jgi:segregation and condensation protein A
MKGGIRSANNPVYNVTLYELLKSYSSVKVQSMYQKISIPKLPVMTTQEGIKQIKENMNSIYEWKKIQELIPEYFIKSKKFKKTGLAAIFSASLELTKDGVVNLIQKKLFDDILIRAARHTPLKLKEK